MSHATEEKIGAEAVGTLESLIKEGRDAIEKQDDAKVTDVLARLEKEAHSMATKLYESAGAGPGGAPPPDDGSGNGKGGPAAGASGKKGDVIDAEFEESN